MADDTSVTEKERQSLKGISDSSKTDHYIEIQTDDLKVLGDFFERQVLLGEPLEISVSKSDWLYKTVVTPCTEGEVRIPMKVVSDSDLIPVTHSDVIPGTIGAKRRWRSYSA